MEFSDCVLGAGSSADFGFSDNYFDGFGGPAPALFTNGTRMNMATAGDGGIDFGIWADTAAYAVWVDFSSQVGFDDVWGAQAGAGDGFRIDGRAFYDTTAELATLVVGAGNDTLIGGAAIAYGALPSVNAANNAMLVAEW